MTVKNYMMASKKDFIVLNPRDLEKIVKHSKLELLEISSEEEDGPPEGQERKVDAIWKAVSQMTGSLLAQICIEFFLQVGFFTVCGMYGFGAYALARYIFTLLQSSDESVKHIFS